MAKKWGQRQGQHPFTLSLSYLISETFKYLITPPGLEPETACSVVPWLSSRSHARELWNSERVHRQCCNIKRPLVFDRSIYLRYDENRKVRRPEAPILISMFGFVFSYWLQTDSISIHRMHYMWIINQQFGNSVHQKAMFSSVFKRWASARGGGDERCCGKGGVGRGVRGAQRFARWCSEQKRLLIKTSSSLKIIIKAHSHLI